MLQISSGNWDNAASAYAVDLSVALHKRGHQVCFIASPGSPAHRAAIRKQLPRVETIEFKQGRPDLYIKNLLRFRSICQELKPQIIDAHYSPEYLWAHLVAGRTAAVVRTRAGPRSPNSHWGNRVLYNWAAANVACADFIYRGHYRKLRVPEEHRVLIRPGMDVSTFAAGAPTLHEARERLGLSQDERWIGLVGRYTKAKAHTVLLDAFQVVTAKTPEKIRLLLTGIEYDVRISELEIYAERLGIRDRITFMSGKLDDVRTALMALDVLVVPSISSEGIARIALEGLALGLPTVASDLNSLTEIVGDAGILVEPGNVQMLAAGMERALNDVAFRERAKTAGPERITRRYNLVRQIQLTESLFYRLAKRQ